MSAFFIHRKRTLIYTLTLFLICGIGFSLYNAFAVSSYKTAIEQIPEILKIRDFPPLPKMWQPQSVEKYDDGFVSPSVTINYNNGVILRVASSDWDLSKEFSNKNKMTVGNKIVDYYYHKNNVGYVFGVGGGINYAIMCPKHLQGEVEKVIESLN